MYTVRKFSQADLNFFHVESHSVEIMNLSRGLSLDEVLIHYGLKDIDELCDNDADFLQYFFTLGRNRAFNSTMDHLFNQMKGRAGLDAIKYYLSVIAPNWAPDDPTADGNSQPKFEVYLNQSDGDPKRVN